MNKTDFLSHANEADRLRFTNEPASSGSPEQNQL